jgi:NADPH:quinone reductase-like Zn-dependent oxidoreductase
MLPTRMRAALLMGLGGEEQIDVRDDVAVPPVARGQVLVRIRAAAVNNTDLNLRTGWYSKDAQSAADAVDDAGWTGDSLAFPRIQGADGCGEIAAVGPGGDAGRIGERVLIDPILRDTAGTRAGTRYFGSDCDGAFAEFASVPDVNAVPVHSGLSHAELASFPCSYTAAENMLTRAMVAAGETVLVTGASGGVGSAAVQLVRRRNARVIAIAAPAKAAAIRAIGAERVIGRDANLVNELGADSLDAIIDVSGGPMFSQFLEVLRPGGRYATAGAIAGARVSLDLRSLYLKDLTLYGCTIPEPGIFTRLVGYIERGEIRALVSATYPLEQIVEAQRAFAAKGHVGKIVIVL